MIDDNRTVVDSLVTYLREAGYGVLGALTSEDGLKDFVLSRPDLVLLDIALPGRIDAIALLKRMRSISPTSRVVMVTGNATPALTRTALELGALAYIDKPFNFPHLERVVAMALHSEIDIPKSSSRL